MEKLIITAAVAGSVPTRQNNPNIPYSRKRLLMKSCVRVERGLPSPMSMFEILKRVPPRLILSIFEK